jgi:NAD-dependent deacetylase
MGFPHELINILQNASHVAVLTGAGISAESGIPTFREAQTGLWAQYNPEELATPGAFLRNPRLVWEWYAWRRDLIQKSEPNPGHEALAQMENLIPTFTLITQNVDNMHQRAGSRNVIELHGNIFRTKCFSEGTLIDELPDSGETPPHCPDCGAALRPDVVWFGENLPEDALQRAFEAARHADVFFSIGTSAMVHPAASLPRFAAQAGAIIVEVNPVPTPVAEFATYILRERAGKVLPALSQTAWPGNFENTIG